MSTVAFPELEAIRTEMSEGTVEAHFEAITDALRSAAAAPRPLRRRSWRRWLAGLLVGAGVLVPSAAIASDSALPGDALYSVKKLLEPLVSILDDDVVAEHRIEEAEVLAERGGDQQTILGLIDEATEALADRDSAGLEARLDALNDLVTDRSTPRDQTPDPIPTTRPQPEPTREPVGEPSRSDAEPTRPEPTREPAPTPTTGSRPAPTPERTPTPVDGPTPAPGATADRVPTAVAGDVDAPPTPDRPQPTVGDSAGERDRRG